MQAGTDVGFKGILMEHGHNMNTEVDGVVAKNCEDVYNHIIVNDIRPLTYER